MSDPIWSSDSDPRRRLTIFVASGLGLIFASLILFVHMAVLGVYGCLWGSLWSSLSSLDRFFKSLRRPRSVFAGCRNRVDRDRIRADTGNIVIFNAFPWICNAFEEISMHLQEISIDLQEIATDFQCIRQKSSSSSRPNRIWVGAPKARMRVRSSD